MNCLKDIAARYERFNRAIQKGTLKRADAVGLGSQYAWPVDDSHVGMLQTEAARPSLASEWEIPFTISTQESDRDGDIVVSQGGQFQNFQRNPVVFFGHQAWLVPIGVARKTWAEEGKVRSIWKCDHEDPDAHFIHGKVKRGVLSACSISFVPLEAMRREMEKANPQASPMLPLGWVFGAWDLTEWSIVGVPANAGAIRDALDSEKQYITPKLQKALAPYAAQARGKCFSGWCPCPCPQEGSEMAKQPAKKKTAAKCSCNGACGKCKPAEAWKAAKCMVCDAAFEKAEDAARVVNSDKTEFVCTKHLVRLKAEDEDDEPKDLEGTDGEAGGYTESEETATADDVADETPEPEGDEETGDAEEVVYKPSAKGLGYMKSHIQAACDYLDKELPTWDHAPLAKALGRHKDKELTAHMKMYDDLMAEHHPDVKMDDVLASIHKETSGGTGEGEAELIDDGEVPEDEAPLAEDAGPDGGNEAGEQNPSDEPTDELLEEYQQPKAWLDETAEYLTALSKASDTPVVHRAGLKHAAATLAKCSKALVRKQIKQQTGVVGETVPPEFAAKCDKFFRRVFQLTGQKV